MAAGGISLITNECKRLSKMYFAIEVVAKRADPPVSPACEIGLSATHYYLP